MINATLPESSGSTRANPARVLVADDIEANRELLVRRLARLGITDVVQAADGKAAIDIIRSQPLDLVLLDLMMPIMTGFDVLEAMAAEGRTETLPVIVVSAMSEIDSVVRAITLGAEDFLMKPFNPILLRARILPTLEKKQLRDQMRAELSRRRTELIEARHLQLALSPPAYSSRQLAIEFLIEPAREVGGDLIEHVELPDGRHLLALGDVSDKGAAAALMMARTHSMIRSVALRGDADVAAEILQNAAVTLNETLTKANESCMFVTLLLGLYDPASGRFDYVRCGHVPPFVRRLTGTIERLEVAGGLPLGVSGLATYCSGSTTLAAGEMLLVLSDGVTEAVAPSGELFGEDRVTTWLANQPEAIASLVTEVRDHEAGGPPSDDLAILLLRIHELK